MRGIGYTFSLLPSARAILAGAAIIAGALTSAAHGQAVSGSNGSQEPNTKTASATGHGYPDEAAWASAHFSHGGAVALPRPLRPSDAALARRAFAMQARGRMADAIRTTDQMEDKLLLGPILADRYLGRFHRSTVGELTDWLSRYGNTADAAAVHALLASRLPRGVKPPPAPMMVSLDRDASPDPVPENQDEPYHALNRDPALDRLVMTAAEHGATDRALRLVQSRRKLAVGYAAQLRAEVAQVAFTQNADSDALKIAQDLERDTPADKRPSLGYYVAGLAAWRMDRLDVARAAFSAGADAPITTPYLRSASAFWAARAAKRLHDAAGATDWLRRAAAQPLTFYGFLARRMLRLPTGIVPSGQLMSQADVDAIDATPQGKLAFGLLQIGQTDRAEAELRLLWPQAQANRTFGRSLLMVASASGLIDFAAQMADLMQAADGVAYDELRFPVPMLRPAGGFRVDPAMIYALTRLESNFDNTAVSPAGAHGLMQIMPATAQYIMGEDRFDTLRLHEPATNLDIGQRYVMLLSHQDGVDGDLLRLLASYNWGPTNVQHWAGEVRDDGDPLLFMEAIPPAETRAFVPTALVYSWIYAARLHLPAPSLDSLAAGEFPRFTTDGGERKMAEATPTIH
jgi:soluble lytic murein transglycosylase-like protein